MYLLDSDFLVALLRGVEAAREMMQRLEAEGRQATTVVNAFELYHGASLTRAADRNIGAVDQLLARFLVLPVDLPAARRAGLLMADLQQQGMAIDYRDMQVAALALENRLSVVTRNREHFQRVAGLGLAEW